MRLLDTTNLKFREFMSDIPKYAILSHTWGDEEVTYQEMSTILAPTLTPIPKQGYAKIAKTCELARSHGFEYAWVDTCCIDKSSSAELTEAINSMYEWYSGAALCYVHLEDLPTGGSSIKGLPSCRWFSRGWTLQELLAPKDPTNVRFYDVEWTYRGSKSRFISTISKITGISKDVLDGTVPISDCCVAERMSWAAYRKTTRIEDTAYCLLGIFDVNMPLLYGEGIKSFRRLQEEIVKRSNDLTILAWDDSKCSQKTSTRLFAETPAAFANCSMFESFDDDCINFSVTNKGLFVAGDCPLRVVSTKTKQGDKARLYALFLGTAFRSMLHQSGGIYLRKLGPNLFTRDLTLPLAGFGDNEINVMDNLGDYPDYYILIEPKPNMSTLGFWNGALYVPPHDSFEIEDTVPETLWDVTNSLFLKPKPYRWARYPMVIAMAFRGKLLGEDMNLVVLCGDYSNKDEEILPSCKVFWKGACPREEAMIFREGNRNEFIYWSQLKMDAPHILQLSNTVQTRVRDQDIIVSVSFEKGKVPSITEEVEMFSLKFIIDQPLYSQVAAMSI
jgi:hypothetical protein